MKNAEAKGGRYPILRTPKYTPLASLRKGTPIYSPFNTNKLSKAHLR